MTCMRRSNVMLEPVNCQVWNSLMFSCLSPPNLSNVMCEMRRSNVICDVRRSNVRLEPVYCHLWDSHMFCCFSPFTFPFPSWFNPASFHRKFWSHLQQPKVDMRHFSFLFITHLIHSWEEKHLTGGATGIGHHVKLLFFIPIEGTPI